MGDRQRLFGLQGELQRVGQTAYLFERICPNCQSKLEEFWLRQDWLQAQLQNLSNVIEEKDYLLYRIGRFCDFGEALDDLL